MRGKLRAEGCHNSAQLWRRRGLDVAGIDQQSPLPSWRVPSSRRAARLLTTPAEGLTRADRQFVDTLTALVPEIRAAAAMINEFGRIVRERDAAAFEAWLTAARTTALHGFVTGIVSDLAAVQAALSQPWSNGCESAWNKDPVFGVIGIQSGPRGQRV